MKTIITHITLLTIFSICFSCNEKIRTSKNENFEYVYNLKLDNGKNIYDTIVPIDFLSSKFDHDMPYMQLFVEFNYPKLKINIEEDKEAILFNDSIKIHIKAAPFDTIKFLKEFKVDSKNIMQDPFFANSNIINERPSWLPKTEISEIKIEINKRQIQFPSSNYQHLYNPGLSSWRNTYYVNGYLTDKGEIIITLQCGSGAATSIVVFLLDETGKLNKKIVEPVI